MNTNDVDLVRIARSLGALRCWYIASGSGAGTSFSLSLGKIVRRDRKLNNTSHTEEYREFEGEVHIIVWCTWRLDSAVDVITSSDDSVAKVVETLQKLNDSHIEVVDIAPPAWDLTLTFSTGLTLHIFFDHVPGEPSFAGNWSLTTLEHVIEVGPGRSYTIENRQKE